MDEKPTIEELERLLKATYGIVEENNRMVREMRRWARIAFWTKVFVWIVVLFLPLYLYSAFLAPWLSGTNMLGLPSADHFQALLDAYQGN
ncbi:hypothetical protein KKH15_00765 [Patescibacteria group bacterium]|nr:hypothetical protein [Patescibacteria group bacterium]MBU1754942.1 hypothetical protein [Patescibacteria group bacterium]